MRGARCRTAAFSLRDHLSRISGPSIDITVILVGHEPGLAGWFDEDDVFQIQSAIDWAREIYAQAGLGVPPHLLGLYPDRRCQRLRHHRNELGRDRSDQRLVRLPADSLDVFYVTLIQGAGGWSNTDGPCDKNTDDVRTGSVIEVKPQTFLSSLKSRNQWAGILLAHEMGHYLGLDGGTDGDSNIMGADDNPPFGVDEISLNSTGITNSQADTMLMHCAVKSTCA